MRGEVLPADPDQCICVDSVPVVRAHGAAPIGGIQVGSRIAVVDEEQLATPEGGAGVGDPVVDREADLRRLAGLQGDALAGEPRGEGSRRWWAKQGRERLRTT